MIQVINVGWNKLVGLKLLDVSRVFFYAFIFVLPFQMRTLFMSNDFYETGFFNPYLSHFLYINDIFLMLSLLFLGLHFVFKKKSLDNEFVHGDMWLNVIVGLLFVMYVFSLLFSVNKINSAFYLVRYFEFFVVFLLISHGFVKIKTAIYCLLSSLFLVTLIGISQYIFQHSIGLKFLGEPAISVDTLGAAKIALLDHDILRAYGTFSHPNVFAGYLVFAIFFSIYFWKERKRVFTFAMIVFLIGLILTFSRSAFLAVIAGIIVYYSLTEIKISWKYLLIGSGALLLFIVFFDLASILSYRFLIGDENSLYERGILYSTAKQMFFDNLSGVGAGNFTEVVQSYVGDKLMPWQFQPVHNIFVLLLDEIGVWGFGTFVFMFAYLFYLLMKELRATFVDKKFSAVLLSLLFGIFVIGMFDHYFISLYQGQAILWVFLGIVGNVRHR